MIWREDSTGSRGRNSPKFKCVSRRTTETNRQSIQEMTEKYHTPKHLHGQRLKATSFCVPQRVETVRCPKGVSVPKRNRYWINKGNHEWKSAGYREVHMPYRVWWRDDLLKNPDTFRWKSFTSGHIAEYMFTERCLFTHPLCESLPGPQKAARFVLRLKNSLTPCSWAKIVEPYLSL